MTDKNPIIPPVKLVRKWIEDWTGGLMKGPLTEEQLVVAAQAARYGADQELEACCEWVSQWCGRWPDGTRPEDELRAARRPKPPSLKEQALDQLDLIPTHDNEGRTIGVDVSVIRRALEQLNN